MKKTISAAAIVFTAVILIFPTTATEAAREAMYRAATGVVPSLFCFMVASKILVSSGGATVISLLFKPASAVLRLSPDEADCFAVGALCGFPTGAAVAAETSKKNNYSRKRATALAALANNVSPGFMISFVGAGIYHSVLVGLVLYFIQIISAALVALPSRQYRTFSQRASRNTSQSFPILFCKAVSESALSCIYLTGFIVAFSVIAAYASLAAEHFGIPSAPLVSFFEITSGLPSFLSLPYPLSLGAVAFFASFSGLSVIFQSATFLVKCGVSMGKYVMLKVIQGLVAAALSAVILPRVADNTAAVAATFVQNDIPSVALFLLIIATFAGIKIKHYIKG